MTSFGRGDLVKVLFDTGARGVTTCWGVVTAVGPKRLHVTWESGRRQRLHADQWHLVSKVDPNAESEARQDLVRAGVLLPG